MDTFGRDHGDDEYSITGDKQELSFIDFEDDDYVCNYLSNEDEPVVISNPFPFVRGKPQSVFVGETFSYPITLENTTRESVPLWGMKIFCSNPADSFTLSLLKPPSVDSDADYIQRFLEGFSLDDRTLQPQRTLTIWLTCKPKEIGLHTSIVELDVGDDRVERVVFLLAEDKVSQSLSSRKPYSRIPRHGQAAPEFFVVAAHNVKATNKGFNFKLPQFEIPEEVRNLLENKQIPGIIGKGLKREKYADYFSTLLIMEELHLEKEMRNYDTLNAKLKTRRNRLLALELPGLAERRPSLVHGDFVFARLNFEEPNHSTPTHQGYIYRIEADEVILKFREDFHMQHHPRNLYDIQFSCNRVNMRRLYQAVQAAEGLDLNLLFPSEVIERSNKGTPVVPFASLNQKQLLSVEMILGCKGAPPYVIHGPPGTGKTMTVVEAILQLYTKRKNACILVCAASNSAADHILQKIVSDKTAEMKDNEVFRLNASSHQYEDVKHDFLRFCYFENSIFRCPPLKALLCYRVIISTYMSSSLLFAEGIKPGHFCHIFLDEAGQASEPETMVPMANLCRQDTVVVLAGDPKQLGPVVYSEDAKKFGLGISYLERLMTCKHYSNGDRNFITKLVNNYRCHSTILDLPSRLFYSGELIASKEDTSYQKSLLQLLP